MENLDVMVLRTLRDWRQAGRPAILATVTRTWGSSPRPVGSIMALTRHGALVRSASGGCIEDDLLYRYTRNTGDLHVATGKPCQVTYGVSADEAHRFGLPCGGTLELLLEFDPDAATLADLVRRLDQGLLVQRRVDLQNGAVALATPASPHPLTLDSESLCATFGSEYRMFLTGAGQLTGYLATMASFSGFSVTVCDPRSEHSAGWSIAQTQLVVDVPDDALAAFAPDCRSCVIALTHDPKLDDLALLAALDSDAFYIGAIGSRRNNLARRERLAAHFGTSAHQLARLRGPVGIYIGSKTPAEIAVSVTADVIAARNGVTLPEQMDVAWAKKNLPAVRAGGKSGMVH